MRRRFLYLVLALVLAALGCELAAQFDRSKIPADSTDAPLDPPPDDAGEAGTTVDAVAPVIPSNVAPALVDPDGGDLQGVVAIDTSALTIDLGSGPAAPPSGVKLTVTNGAAWDGGVLEAAVLSVGAWLVDKPISVTGARALVILAAGRIEIRAIIDVGAHAAAGGPGGFPPMMGPGAGRPGYCESEIGCFGSSGAGHGTRGADTTDPYSFLPRVPGGAAYAIALVGGSGGGTRIPGFSPSGSDAGLGLGGAGGGAVQFFSRVGLVVTPTGAIRASGGGGIHGDAYFYGWLGGAGGAGGFALLEAPHVAVSGTIAANGGGGGGSGGDGADGVLGSSPADGGARADGCGGCGAGGSGGSIDGPPTSGTIHGSGGAAGRIIIRTRGVNADRDGGVISPAPTLDTSL